MADPNGSLHTAGERVEEGGQAARRWIDEVRDESSGVRSEADSLIETTRRARLAARRTRGAVDRRNCVGVFGPSQAGKSYLVSALARRRGSPLEIDFAGEVKDFLKEINPAGDRESTGLVSRFTRRGSAPDPGHPVELRLLSETDLVKIIANSFLCDFDPNDMSIDLPDDEGIREAVRAAESAKRSGRPIAGHLDEVELFDLREYFHRHFRSRIGALDRADYWNALIETAPWLPTEERARLFAMLWGGLQPLTELFASLAEALERIGNAPEARASMSSLTPRETGDPPRPNTVVDVAVLDRLGSAEDAADRVSVKPAAPGAPDRPAAELPRATLTALIAEVRLVMTDAPWPFFEDTDLLDFPGARSRLKLARLPADPDDRRRQIRELFLRGKIAYLFQRYTDELELTAMLLCMPPSVQEVKDLAGMVRSWIETTHGATPAERRDRNGNALFLVLTKFDLEFLEKGGETPESRRGKWDRRLHSSFLELYGKDGWPEDWDGAPFSNTVFLRNPGMKQVHLMEYEDEGRLLEARPGSAGAIGEYRDAYMDSALVERHFEDRSGVWEAAMQPNDGGVEYLVGRLSGVLDPGLKRRQGAKRLGDAARALGNALGRFFHGEGDEARRERDRRLLEVRRSLFRAVGAREYRPFAHFVDALTLSGKAARGVFLNVAAMREQEVEAQGEAGVGEEAGGDPWAAHDPWAEGPPSAEAPCGGAASAGAAGRERPDVFAERIINVWTAKLRRLPQDEAMLKALGLPREAVADVVDDLITGSDRHGLRDRIADAVRKETLTVGARWEEMADRATLIAAYEINDYVAYLGFGGLAEEDRPEFEQHAVFSPDALRVKGVGTGPEEVGIGPEREPLERVFFLDWGVAFRSLGMDNVGHAPGREISGEHNRELGRILEVIDVADALRAAERAGAPGP